MERPDALVVVALFWGLCLTSIDVRASEAAAGNGSATESAAAQPSDDGMGNDRVTARFVGVSGGVVVGAEAVLAVQAAFGLDKMWMYLAFPAIGAAAGGVGGYFLEKASIPGAVALLVTGIALAIPTAIFTISAFSYDPKNDNQQVGTAHRTSVSKNGTAESPPSSVEEEETVTEVSPPETGPPRPDPASHSETDGDVEAPRTAPEKEGAAHAEPRGSSRARQGSGSGALIAFDASWRPQLGVPFLAVRPALVVDSRGRVLAERGVEVVLPILYGRLP